MIKTLMNPAPSSTLENRTVILFSEDSTGHYLKWLRLVHSVQRNTPLMAGVKYLRASLVIAVLLLGTYWLTLYAMLIRDYLT